jgi:lipopolysaccharide transport system ATP-binding protein
LWNALVTDPGLEPALIEFENVSKKFCRSLKRSLLYGAQDVVSALLPWTESSAANQEALRKDEFWAVKDLSFTIRRGHCLGLIGHNGAGKSTVLKLLNGLIPPDHGRITTRGRVSALIDLNAGFNPILTGRENVYNQAALLGLTAAEVVEDFDKIIAFSEIGEFIDMPVQHYSSGMRVRLGFAIAVHTRPDILIIDEVLAVGDVAFRYKSLNAIGELMKSTAVVFVSHAMPQIFRLCDEVIVMDHGIATYGGRDVARGVAMYMSLFKEGVPTITGSGEVQLSSFRASTDSTVTSTSEPLQLSYGAALELRAGLRASPGVSRANVQFLVWNAEMLPVLEVMANDLNGYGVSLSDRFDTDVVARVPNINLNAGKYSVTVIVMSDDNGRVLCRHDNAAFLEVETGSPSGAHVISVADWESAPDAS